MIWILLLLLLSYGYDACKPGFDETINIRVLDKQGRPVPNVSVQLQFLLDGSVSPKRYKWTPVKKTNEVGLVSFRVYNTQKYWPGLDCDIKVNLTLYNETYSYEVRNGHIRWYRDYILTLRNKTEQYLYRIEAYKLKMRFKEGNVSVPAKLILYKDYIFPNITYFESFVPKYVDGYATYKGIKRYFNYVLKNDSYYEIEFRKSRFSLEVLNDRLEPLSCVFYYDNTSVSFTGELNISDFKPVIQGYVVCDGKNKTVSIMPYSKRKLILDVTPPEVKNFRVIKADTEYVTFAFDVWDPNTYASGVQRVELRFNGDIYPAIDVKGSSYYYRVPNIQGTMSVKAFDREDNIKSVLLNYTPKIVEPTAPKEGEKKEEGGGDITWLVALVGIIVLGGIVWFIKSKFEEPEEF